MSRLVALVLVALLGLGACSASGGSSDGSAGSTGPGASATSTTRAGSTTTTKPETTDDSRAAYSVAWSDEYVDLGNDDRCLSGRLVDLFGVERLNAAGITPEVFAAGEIFTALEVDPAEREEVTGEVAAAIVACHIAERLATEWLSSDDEADDLTAFTPCVAKPLVPLLAGIVVEGWAGERADDVFDATTDALEVADAECPEVQVESADRALAEDGPPLTDEERACALEEYQQLATEHRALTGDDDARIAETCLQG
jgi:hypothetical protein